MPHDLNMPPPTKEPTESDYSLSKWIQQSGLTREQVAVLQHDWIGGPFEQRVYPEGEITYSWNKLLKDVADSGYTLKVGDWWKKNAAHLQMPNLTRKGNYAGWVYGGPLSQAEGDAQWRSGNTDDWYEMARAESELRSLVPPTPASPGYRNVWHPFEAKYIPVPIEETPYRRPLVPPTPTLPPYNPPVAPVTPQVPNVPRTPTTPYSPQQTANPILNAQGLGGAFGRFKQTGQGAAGVPSLPSYNTTANLAKSYGTTPGTAQVGQTDMAGTGVSGLPNLFDLLSPYRRRQAR